MARRVILCAGLLIKSCLVFYSGRLVNLVGAFPVCTECHQNDGESADEFTIGFLLLLIICKAKTVVGRVVWWREEGNSNSNRVCIFSSQETKKEVELNRQKGNDCKLTSQCSIMPI